MTEIPGEIPSPKDRRERRAKKQADRVVRRVIDLAQARTQAKLITNAARQKLMLDVIDDLEACRNRVRGVAGRRERKSREEFEAANRAIKITDDEGRAWVVRFDLPNGTTFVDNDGVLWKYDAPEKHLSRINDG